jgi:hypothetical protein
MKQLILLVESAEQLDEIEFKKADATAGMIGALAGAPQDTQASTDAAQGIDSNQPVATQQVSDPKQAQPKGEVLHNNFIAGMTLEQVQKLAPGGKTKDEFKEFRAYPGGTVMYSVPGAPGESGKKGSTNFAFDDNGKLSAIHFGYTLANNKAGPFAPAVTGEGLIGRKQADLGYWFKKAYNLIPDQIKSTPTGKAQVGKGGQFGLGIGGVTGGGKGFAIGLDKVGTAQVRLNTNDGQIILNIRTQTGVASSFHMMGMVITKTASTHDSAFDISM